MLKSKKNGRKVIASAGSPIETSYTNYDCGDFILIWQVHYLNISLLFKFCLCTSIFCSKMIKVQLQVVLWHIISAIQFIISKEIFSISGNSLIWSVRQIRTCRKRREWRERICATLRFSRISPPFFVQSVDLWILSVDFGAEGSSYRYESTGAVAGVRVLCLFTLDFIACYIFLYHMRVHNAQIFNFTKYNYIISVNWIFDW